MQNIKAAEACCRKVLHPWIRVDTVDKKLPADKGNLTILSYFLKFILISFFK